MNQHPNATVSLASGSGVGTLVVWGLAHWISLPPEAGAAIAGAVGAFALFVGRNGVKGLWSKVMHGNAPAPE